MKRQRGGGAAGPITDPAPEPAPEPAAALCTPCIGTPYLLGRPLRRRTCAQVGPTIGRKG